MIPTPNLDDRTFEDIVAEAIRLIPQYCPEWTNHNRGDPGITLIELFAWMTEMTLYRLNRVPDKNFLAFLELMGVSLTPPQPARTVLKFQLHPKADRVLVPAGTRVGTRPGPDGQSIVFETEHDAVVPSATLALCMSQYHEQFSDHTLALGKKREGVPLWSGVRSVERYLYVGDPRLAAFCEGALLWLRSTLTSTASAPLCKVLEWEYFDGERWTALASAAMETEPDQLALIGPPQLQPATVGDWQGLCLRGKLSEVPSSPERLSADVLTMRLELAGDGERPDLAFANPQAGLFLRLDTDRHLQPFGKAPAVDSALYVACARVLEHPDADVRIDVELADPHAAPPPLPSADLLIHWEYWNGKRWKLLGQSGIGDHDVADPGFAFADETQCLTSSGYIAFRRPRDLQPTDVHGKTATWVRARIERGDYGVAGSYELENDRWVWKDPRPLRPPTLRSLALRFVEAEHTFAKVLAYNDFVYTDLTAQAAEPHQPLVPFVPVAEESPTLYLGWKLANWDGPNPPGPQPFPNERVALYVELAEQDGKGARLRAGPGQTSHELSQTYAEQVIAWEYWNGKEWLPLLTRDLTYGFTQSGFVEFVGPADHRPHKRFGHQLYWLRARLEFGGYDEPPMLRNVHVGAAWASNATTYTDTVLGSSRGTPNQRFVFVRGPVLPGEVVVVRERERPPGPELEDLLRLFGPDAVMDDPDGDGVWVRWQAVDSLYESAPNARHYVKDLVDHSLTFGDGIHGLVPPKGDRNVVCRRYQVGDGERGNVPADAVTILLQSVPYIDGVRNLFAASGGCDLESIEAAKRRGPHSLKARSRAVTAEDFAWLAMEASNSVARVCALPTRDKEGEVSVVVVPKVAETGADGLDKPVPSTELLRKVRNHLADRKLLTTIVHVQRPIYRELSVQVEIVVLQTAGSDRVKREMDRRIRTFLHPLRGGRDGKGWPFGRPVYRVDLYHVIEDVPGVDFVDRVRLLDAASKLEVDQFKVGPGELVHVVRVDVVEKAHERIV